LKFILKKRYPEEGFSNFVLDVSSDPTDGGSPIFDIRASADPCDYYSYIFGDSYSGEAYSMGSESFITDTTNDFFTLLNNEIALRLEIKKYNTVEEYTYILSLFIASNFLMKEFE
jgi:hypothetical protein